MEKSEIREIINFMNSIYVHKPIHITSDILDVWHEMIGEYSKEQVKSLIKQIAREESYAPNLATLAEKLNKSFKVRTKTSDNFFTVFVDFNESRFPFVFRNMNESKELIEFLKKNPPMRDVRFYHNEHLHKRAPYAVSIR